MKETYNVSNLEFKLQYRTIVEQIIYKAAIQTYN